MIGPSSDQVMSARCPVGRCPNLRTTIAAVSRAQSVESPLQERGGCMSIGTAIAARRLIRSVRSRDGIEDGRNGTHGHGNATKGAGAGGRDRAKSTEVDTQIQQGSYCL